MTKTSGSARPSVPHALCEIGRLLALGYQRLKESQFQLEERDGPAPSCGANPGHRRESRLGRGPETQI